MHRRSTLRIWLLACALSGTVSCLLTAPSDDELVGSCGDGKKNGPETDVDCGGGCRPCGESRGCKVAADCTSSSCVAGGCAAPSCADHVKNGTETDVDCGSAAACPYCKLGQGCLSTDDCDCETECYVCVMGRCAHDTCANAKTDGDETDIDCGGSCVTCVTGQKCTIDDDCDGACVMFKCADPSCTDNKLDGTESDTDCGGDDMACPRCGVGKLCTLDTDCMPPAVCGLRTGVCT